MKSHVVLAAVAVFVWSQAAAQSFELMPIVQSWRYSTNNLDGVQWKAVNYVETGWSNPSPALFYIESSALPAPKNTPLPQRAGGGPMRTYYFRTSFNVSDASAITSLTFSNLIDDGAIFYLNGVEIQRVGVAFTNVTYSSFANRSVGSATSFDVFSISGSALTNLVTGNNVLAVEVHQINATSSDVVFGCALLGSTNVNVTRGPYLQNGSHTNVTVRWRTDAISDSRVRYGTNLADLEFTADQIALTNEHQVTLTQLLPDTKYFYSVGTSTEELVGGDTNHFFVTAPLPGTPKQTRIWVLGDPGTANANQVNVRNAYQNFAGSRHTDLWLMLGDNAYNTGTDAEYQKAVFNLYTNVLPNSVLWSTLGNHETAQATTYVDTYPYFDIFTFPKNGEAGGIASGTEHYYSFDYGNIHFVCLDSMTANRSKTGAMAMWLTNDLANTTAEWIIAFFHHPPYTKGSHNSDSDSDSSGSLVQMRTNFVPLLEDAGVDLVLSGHSHSYERSFLLDRHYAYSTGFSSTNKLDGGSGREDGSGAYLKPHGGPIGHQGTVYVVAGSSGQTSGGNLNHPAMYLSLNNLGSLVLDVSSNRLDAKFIRENGVISDYFTILKANYPPIASNLMFTVPGDVASSLNLAGNDINHDEITFVTNSLPENGLITDFNPENGAFIYTPSHAFAGTNTFFVSAFDGQTNSEPAMVTINVASPQDLDGDGLPDSWESVYGTSDPNADSDGDGLTNLEEYFADTNPTNAASLFRISTATLGLNGHMMMTWQSIGGVRYRVQFKDDLNDVFSGLARSVTFEMDPFPPGTISTRSFTDDFSLTGGAPTNGTRFFRVQTVR